ncbi:MAG: DMT family transporter [Neptuniibacter sp.]
MREHGNQTIFLALLFVLVYGSGFVGAKLGMGYSEPFTFLAIRFAIAGGLLIFAAILLSAPWPTKPGWILLTGLLMQGMFSVGVFYALYLGMKPAVCALIIALQPLLVTVLAGPYLQEQVSRRRWLGLLIGVAGVAVVVADGLAVEGITWSTLAWAVVGLLGLSCGQLIQKKHCADMHLISGGALQVLGATPVMLLLALTFESHQIQWHLDLIIAIFWMAVGVSLGAVTLLYILISQNSASQVASVFYGIPVAAALIAWPLFDQTPTLADWIGFIVVMLGIAVANWKTNKARYATRTATPARG